MDNPEQWYWDIPCITRVYSTCAVITALLVQFKYIQPIQLYYHPELVFYQFQWWRLLTNFLYFGSFGIDFIFHMFFMNRYLRLLEEEFYRHKKADFMFFLLFCMSCLLLLGPFFGVAFLGSPLIYAIVYLWSKRNPFVMMNFLGLFNFTAPYLPFVLFGFSLLISNQFPLGDFLGIVVGHIFFFLQDVYPRQHGGHHLLHTPYILKILFQELPEAEPSPAASRMQSEGYRAVMHLDASDNDVDENSWTDDDDNYEDQEEGDAPNKNDTLKRHLLDDQDAADSELAPVSFIRQVAPGTLIHIDWDDEQEPSTFEGVAESNSPTGTSSEHEDEQQDSNKAKEQY